MNQLFTIGHSSHAAEYFVGLLVQHKITAICDVRSFPMSRRNPQFNRETLKPFLKKNGIAYVFLGKELGARSDDPRCYENGRVQYHRLAETRTFYEGLARVRRGLHDYRVALMCAERDPITCHRMVLVCRYLRSPGLSIGHILSDGSVESHCAAAAERR